MTIHIDHSALLSAGLVLFLLALIFLIPGWVNNRPDKLLQYCMTGVAGVGMIFIVVGLIN
jgi:uncharacterized membrane protein